MDCLEGENRSVLKNIVAQRVVFDKYCDVILDGSRGISFEGFCSMASELHLPVAVNGSVAQRDLFQRLAGHQKGVQDAVFFDEFSAWVTAGNDVDALAVQEAVECVEDASLYGAIVRSMTKLTRPLVHLVSQAVLQVKIQFKHMFMLVVKKFGAALKKSMMNPIKLFRRQAINPADVFNGHSVGLLIALRTEFQLRGFRGVAGKALGPYIANSFVAVCMFHTYTTAKQLQQCFGSGDPHSESESMYCEATSGIMAGIVQATLTAPLHNMKLQGSRIQQDGVIVRKQPQRIRVGLQSLYQHHGLSGMFRNYPYLLVQECCSLGAFFASYQFFKQHTTDTLRRHVDPSGRYDTCAWALAASGAGIVLAGVGTPFENLHEWHSARSSLSCPRAVLPHFLRDARPRTRTRILMSGLRRKIPLAPLAGLPLLTYEVMMHNGIVPSIHDDEA